MKLKSILAAVVLLAASSLTAAPLSLVFGAVDSNASTNAYDAIVKHLNSTPAYKVTLKVFPTYGALYDAFKSKSVDLAYVGAVKYVEAHQDLGVIPLVTDGTVQSVIFVRKGSPIKNLDEIKGKSFAFGYEDSTSTYLMPVLLLSKHHLTVQDLGRHEFLGVHQESIMEAVASGKFDAGAAVTPLYEANKDKLRALEISETFPGAPVIVRKETDPKLLEDLRKLFLKYQPSTPEEVKQRFGHGVIAADDSQFNKVRFLCQVVFHKSYH
jgi:phosphonate transport system substrate-binding protein